jgi:fimbrial chaperone protein
MSITNITYGEIPVFVVNKDAITKLNWSIQQEQNNAYLTISNVGNRHALLNNLILVDTTANKSYTIKVNTVNGYKRYFVLVVLTNSV